MVAPLRRVVTGHDAEGKSLIVADGVPPAYTERLTELWWTDAMPTDNGSMAGDTVRPPALMPPDNGSLFRILRLEPGSEVRSAEEFRAHMAAMGAAYAVIDQSRHAGMHRTYSLDYLVVLRGELTLILDKDETVLRAMDSIVQRGTNHAWANRGDEDVYVACVNLPASPR